MKELLSKKTFLVGAYVGLKLITILNIFSFAGTFNVLPRQFCASWFGFPFPFYLEQIGRCELAGGLTFEGFDGYWVWWGAVGNFAFAALFAFALGLVAKWIAERLTAKKLR